MRNRINAFKEVVIESGSSGSSHTYTVNRCVIIGGRKGFLGLEGYMQESRQRQWLLLELSVCMFIGGCSRQEGEERRL